MTDRDLLIVDSVFADLVKVEVAAWTAVMEVAALYLYAVADPAALVGMGEELQS